MFKRTKQLIKANTLLKEESENLKREYEKKVQETAGLSHLLYEMNMGYFVCSVMVLEDTEQFIIQYASDSILENGRLKGKEIIGESVRAVFPSFAEHLIKLCKEAVASGNRTSFIEYDEIEDRYLKFICYEEREHCCGCVIYDITDSFLSEKLLEDREERYRSMFMVSEQFLFELDLEGRFTYISEGIRQVLGYEPEEYLGRYYYEQYPVDVRKQAAHSFQKCFNECGQMIQGLMTELLAKDGRHHFAIQNGVVLIDEDGRDVGYRGIYIDVTEMEKERRKAEQAVSTHAELVDRISHEIRTPLNGIIGLTSLALDEPRTYKVYRYLQKMEETATELLDIMNAVRDYSKISEDEICLYEEAFSLQLVIKKVTSLLAIKAQEKNLQLIVEAEKEVPDTYSGDSMRLSQILNSLLASAIKDTQQGYVKLMIRKRDKGLLFIIKDTSSGIEEELLRRMDQPITREEEARITKQKGSGLGVLISKQLIEAMGGRMKVISKENEGTKVYVALPLKQCKEDLVRSTEREFRKQTRLNHYEGSVLVVENNAANQIVVCDLLEKFGLQVTAVKDGKTACSLVLDHGYDLIFLDLCMPARLVIQSGIQMRRQGVTAPIIAMTANPIEAVSREYSEARVDDYITKPLNIYKLEYILQKYLSVQEAEEYTACTSEEIMEEEQMVYPFTHVMYRSAVARLDQDYELYNKIVFSFIKEYQHQITTFINLISVDKKAARFYIHTLQGAAETLGANELSALARQLEEMLLKNKIDSGLVGLYTEELKAVLRELIPYAQTIPMPVYHKGYQEDMALQFMDHLEELLVSHSAMAVEEITAIYELLYREDVRKTVDILINQIENYEFGLAQKTLGRIRESLGVKV